MQFDPDQLDPNQTDPDQVSSVNAALKYLNRQSRANSEEKNIFVQTSGQAW